MRGLGGLDSAETEQPDGRRCARIFRPRRMTDPGQEGVHLAEMKLRASTKLRNYRSSLQAMQARP
jgi:hypothetical protein